ITQVGNLSVDGLTILSAENTITLTDANELSRLSITQAQAAEIHNEQNLELDVIQNVDVLDLSVDGDLSHSVALDLDHLILAVTGGVDLAEPANRIANLSGEVA